MYMYTVIRTLINFYKEIKIRSLILTPVVSRFPITHHVYGLMLSRLFLIRLVLHV